MGGLFIETDAIISLGTQLVVDLRFLKKHLPPRSPDLHG
jgi:hypothetical protein